MIVKLRASFAPEIDRIEVWGDPCELPRPLPAYDAVYIDGGNTFQLMATVRSAGLGPAMADYLAAVLFRPDGRQPEPIGSAGLGDLALLFADVGQALAHLDDQRIAIGQRALQAVDRVAQQRAGVAVAP